MWVASFLLIPCTLCAAWGPVSHVVFASNGLAVFDATVTDAPDGWFGFMGSQFSYAPYAAACPVEEKLHDPVVAGRLVQRALSGPAVDPQYLVFLLSFQSHMIGDMVGFWPGKGTEDYGYLTDRGRVDAGLNWVTLWPKMQMVDAYLMQQNQLGSLRIPYLNHTHIGWFARDVAIVANLSYTAAVLEQCGNGWIDVQNRLIAYYKTLGDVTPQLAFFDSRGANVTVAETTAYLAQNVDCAGRAVRAYTKSILAMMEPTEAFSSVESLVGEWYAAKQCSQ